MHDFLGSKANTRKFNCEIMLSQNLSRHSQTELFKLNQVWLLKIYLDFS
jgi:hypothetical protein